MRKIALFSASALVLALGVASASAEPFNPVTGYSHAYSAPSYGYNGGMNEGRSAAEDGFNYGGATGWTTGSPILQQFHEGK
jgi:hypothetical protein